MSIKIHEAAAELGFKDDEERQMTPDDSKWQRTLEPWQRCKIQKCSLECNFARKTKGTSLAKCHRKYVIITFCVIRGCNLISMQAIATCAYIHNGLQMSDKSVSISVESVDNLPEALLKSERGRETPTRITRERLNRSKERRRN